VPKVFPRGVLKHGLYIVRAFGITMLRKVPN